MTYDVLGAVYEQDEHIEVTRSFYRAIRPLLAGLRDGVILDLGCASGLLTEHLAAANRRVVGIDLSVPMLRLARSRCRRFGRKVTFEEADLRTFGGTPAAARAFACGDIVNHFTSARELGRFFRNVRKNLEPGGMFVFDALNRWCFEHYWPDRTYYFEGEKGDIVMECDWDAEAEVGTARMTIYKAEAKGRYTRGHMTLHEHLYSNEVLSDLLSEAGFSSVSYESWSPWSDQHEEESNDRTLWKAIR